jgi:hypothetical protein
VIYVDASVALAHLFAEDRDLLDLSPEILHRALEPFPVYVRTLDALRLATIDFLRRQGSSVELATYDSRLAAAAQTLGIALCGADAR